MNKAFLIIIINILVCFHGKGQGLFSWAKGLGGSEREISCSVAVDASGNVFSTGTFSGTADFDPGPGIYTLTPNGGYDMYVSKLDANGNFMWAKQIGGTLTDQGMSIAVDPSGNVCIVGFFSSTVDFDPGPAVLTFSANADVVIVKLNPSGNLIWAKQFKSPTWDWDYPYGISIDQTGNVYSTGYFSKTVDFDPGPGTYTLTASGLTDVFVSKLDVNGSFVWAKQFAGNGLDESHAIAVDKLGNVYTTGRFGSITDFDPGLGFFPLAANGGYDAFLCKLDSSGNFAWAMQFGNWDYDVGWSVAVDAQSNVYATGFFGDPVDFDPGISVSTFTTNVGDRDIFITKFDTYGTFVWAKQIGNFGYEVSFGICLDDKKNVYTTGIYGNTDFDPGPGKDSLQAYGDHQVFVSVLDSMGNYVWAKRLGGDRAYGIALDASRNVHNR